MTHPPILVLVFVVVTLTIAAVAGAGERVVPKPANGPPGRLRRRRHEPVTPAQTRNDS